MQKSTKANFNILTQSAGYEQSQDVSLEEMDLLNQQNEEKLKWWSSTLDFISGGNFSTYTDNVRNRIWKNRIKILDESQKLIQQSGLQVKPIELKLQKEIIGNISTEEDETLQNKWVALLANASTSRVSTHIVYAKILSELTSDEVSILDFIKKSGGEFVKQDFLKDSLKSTTVERLKESIDILFSKRLIQTPPILGDNTIILSLPLQSNTYDIFGLTNLGESFVDACTFVIDKKQDSIIKENYKINQMANSQKGASISLSNNVKNVVNTYMSENFR